MLAKMFIWFDIITKSLDKDIITSTVKTVGVSIDTFESDVGLST